MMDTCAVIQARTGSTRLSEKVMMKLAEKTVLEHVIERVSRSELVDDIVVATTVNKLDLKIVELAAAKGISVFCGSEEDVLDRFYQAARLFKMNNIVRITADCPLVDPEIIDDIVRVFKDDNADYATNTIEETFPDGLDVEVFSFEALAETWRNAKLLSEREHVTSYIRNNKNRFKTASFKNDTDLSDKRWTLDREEDFDLLSRIFEGVYCNNPEFRMRDVIDYLDKHGEIEKINSHIARNEGYIKSLKQDTVLEARN